MPETERVRGRALAEALTLPDLARAWQVLLKGLGEARSAPSPLQAAEMVLIRLAHASQLPRPGRTGRPAARQHGSGHSGAGRYDADRPDARRAGFRQRRPRVRAACSGRDARRRPGRGGGPELLAETRTEPAGEPISEAARDPRLESFEAVVALVRAQRETILANHLERDLHLVHFEPGRIEFRPAEAAPRNLAGQLGALLQAATGARWMVSRVRRAGGAVAGRTGARARGRIERGGAPASPGPGGAGGLSRRQDGRSKGPARGPVRRSEDIRGGRRASMKNLGQMMKQAQEMQAKMAEMQEQLAEIEVTGASRRRHDSGDAQRQGARCARSQIDPALVDPNEVEVLEDLIVAATNDAKAKAEAQAAQRMSELTGGLNLPPGFKLPF